MLSRLGSPPLFSACNPLSTIRGPIVSLVPLRLMLYQLRFYARFQRLGKGIRKGVEMVDHGALWNSNLLILIVGIHSTISFRINCLPSNPTIYYTTTPGYIWHLNLRNTDAAAGRMI